MKPWEVRNAAALKAWVARGRTSRFGISARTYAKWMESYPAQDGGPTLAQIERAIANIRERVITRP